MIKINISATDKRYLAALIVLTGVIMFWSGLSNLIAIIPIVKNPFVSLFLGLLIITLTGAIFREFDPITQQIANTMEVLTEVLSRKNVHENYDIHYFDEASKMTRKIKRRDIKRLEHNFLILEEKGKEIFIPVHRVHKIMKNGRVIWKK